jgi:hypothetical protein
MVRMWKNRTGKVLVRTTGSGGMKGSAHYILGKVEEVLKEFHFLLKTIRIADGLGPVNQGGEHSLPAS